MKHRLHVAKAICIATLAVLLASPASAGLAPKAGDGGCGFSCENDAKGVILAAGMLDLDRTRLGGAGSALLYEYGIAPYCVGAIPEKPGSVECTLMGTFCNDKEGNGPAVWVYARLSGEPTWERLGWTCYPDLMPGKVDWDMIAAAFHRTDFAKPTVAIQPVNARTLVRLPTYFEADFPEAGYEPNEVDDLNPAAGGQILFAELSDRAVATWLNVPKYASAHLNTFQIELFFDGTIRMSWTLVQTPDSLVGLSNGNGVPPDYLESNLTRFRRCPPDFDLDGDVDLTDFGHLQSCLTGIYPNLNPACMDANIDEDPNNRIDSVDVQKFVRCLTGPAQLADLSCLP